MDKTYPYIAAYCRMVGSYTYYIADEIARAKAENAPHDAIFRRFAKDGSGPTGVWATYSELDQGVKDRMRQYLPANCL